MKSSTRTTSLLTATVMLGLASLVWLYIALQGKRTQAEQSLFNANLLQTRADNANRTGNLSVAQASLKTAERRLLDLAVQNRDAENRLFALQPELRWVTPPARLPDWNPASPYVWVRKEALGRINVPALQLNGDLTPEVCVMLDLTPEVKGLITVAAKSMIDQFGKKTVELSEVVPLPTNGIKLEANQQAVTVKVAPFEAYALSLKEEFETAVRETLDPQRAGLLLQWSYGTVDMLITRHVYETKYITLLKEPSGYRLRVLPSSSRGEFAAGSLENLVNIYQDLFPPKLIQHLGNLIESAPSALFPN